MVPHFHTSAFYQHPLYPLNHARSAPSIAFEAALFVVHAH